MLREIWITYGGRVMGITAALFLGFIYLLSGFWDMLFVGLLLWIGYFFGKQKDLNGGQSLPWNQLLAWFNDRFRSFK